MERHTHLRRVPITLPHEASIIYFVTCCTHRRSRVFTTETLVNTVLNELTKSRERLGWLVGGVFFMPDHVHLFCSPLNRDEQQLPKFIGAWRAASSRRLKEAGLEEPFWQNGFFDHILRSDESYESKWQYVRLNPDRAGIHDFPRWFEIDQLQFR